MSRVVLSVLKHVCCSVTVLISEHLRDILLLDLSYIKVIKVVPFPILKRFDVRVVVPSNSTPRMDKNSVELINEISLL
jgi:hypothetical protein